MTTKSRKQLQKLAEAVLFEVRDLGPEPGYIQHGQHDQPIVSNPDEDNPILVDPTVSSESLLNLPPVDDPDYAPVSIADLKLALYALAQDVPGENVEAFFRAVRRKVEELSATIAISEAKGGGYFGADDNEDDDWDQLDDLEKGAAARLEPGADDYKYEDIAQIMGFTSSSAPRNIELRATKRMEYILDKIPLHEYEGLMDEAVEAFTFGMRSLGMIDDQDVAVLLTEKDHVKSLPSFKYYFNNAYTIPAFKALETRAHEKVSDALDQLDITQPMKEFILLTILNQIAGDAKENPKIILRKLQRGNPSKTNPVDAIDPDLAQDIYAEYLRIYPSLKRSAHIGDELVDIARVIHSKKSSSKIAKEIKHALKSADSDYESE